MCMGFLLRGDGDSSGGTFFTYAHIHHPQIILTTAVNEWADTLPTPVIHNTKINYIYLSNWVKCMPQTAQINKVCEHNACEVSANLKGWRDKRIKSVYYRVGQSFPHNHRSAFDRRPIEF